MKPYNPLRNKIDTIKKKIKKRYYLESLMVIEEDMVPRTKSIIIKEED